VHAELATRDLSLDYASAKAGDPRAATELVQTLLNLQALKTLEELAFNCKPYLASVSALEEQGFNAIPDAMAGEIGEKLGWPLDAGELRQITRVSHTGASGWHRLVTQAEFAGEVIAGANYVLVDDHVGFGGTLANLRSYIEARKGRVVAMTTLTETTGARTIVVKRDTLDALRAKHGSALEELWKENLGYGLDCCTEIEAGYLCRQTSFDQIRRRLAKAAKKARNRGLSATEI